MTHRNDRNHVQAIAFLHYWPVVLALLESHQTISAPLAPDGTCVMKRFNLGLATCSASVQLQWYDICDTKSWCNLKYIFWYILGYPKKPKTDSNSNLTLEDPGSPRFCDFHTFFQSVSWCSMCLSYRCSIFFDDFPGNHQSIGPGPHTPALRSSDTPRWAEALARFWGRQVASLEFERILTN